MIKSITESKEAIFFKDSPIERTFENFLTEESKKQADEEIRNKIMEHEKEQREAFIANYEVSNKYLTKSLKKTNNN